MKLNPEFLSMCRRAKELAGDDLEIRFVPAFAVGITYLTAQAEIQRQVPGSVVLPHMDYATYLGELQRCEPEPLRRFRTNSRHQHSGWLMVRYHLGP